ncbi:MobA/MobL family protein [Sphingomonas sp. CL5.1]|uniref:MobA/MobL family protein n=1 Tax=Sphingomonas sp. CL5.1 TaxID=2653203 RepID=UPI0015816AA5|nr:MobA/MobL family protein [Sphingomonas sp. CL5.1]QKR99248.1 MobA/MobL family protein [Sphingomonas sp. CL5.1]
MAGLAKSSHPDAVQLVDRLYFATEAMRAMIARMALEELGGSAKAGKVRAEKKDERKRSAAWSPRRSAIDLSYPAPPRGRPTNADGATSFHFALSSVSKVRPAPGRSAGIRSNPALNFERYVTDLQADQFDRAMGVERYVTDEPSHEGAESRTAFVISNISSIAAEREAFWVAVNQAASTPSHPRLEIRPQRCGVAELRTLADEHDTPETISRALHELADGLSHAGGIAPRKVHRIDLDDAAFAWAQTLDGDRFGSRRDERLVHLVRPRGGVLQWQIESEFPAELDDDDNRAIAGEFGSMLGRLGLRYTIAVHDPTHRNDVKNRHPHVLIYPGACCRHGDDSWDFSKGKIQPGEIALRLGKVDREALPKLRFEQRSAADVNALRQHFADIINEKLAERNVRRRYDPRSYREMRIDQVPSEHLGGAAAALVAAGRPVEIDHRNAVKGWAGRQRQAADQIGAERARHASLVARIDATDPDNEDPALATLKARYIGLAERFVAMQATLSTHDLHAAMARSAAERLAGKSGDMLDAIEAGRASPDEARAIAAWRARNEIALAHLDAIDEALEPHAQWVEAARDEVADGRVELRAIEQQIGARIKLRDQVASAERDAEKWAAETVLSPKRYPVRLGPQEHYDALRKQLLDQRTPDADEPVDRFIYIVRKGDWFEPVGLRAADRAIVARQPYRRLFDGVLSKAGEIQEVEVGRVIAYIAAHGEAPLTLNEATAPRTPRRHYRLYQQHPTFRRLLPEARRKFEAMQGHAGARERPVAALPVGASTADLASASATTTAVSAPTKNPGAAASRSAFEDTSPEGGEVSPAPAVNETPTTRSPDVPDVASPDPRSRSIEIGIAEFDSVGDRPSQRDADAPKPNVIDPVRAPERAPAAAAPPRSPLPDAPAEPERARTTRAPKPMSQAVVEKGSRSSIEQLREVVRERTAHRPAPRASTPLDGADQSIPLPPAVAHPAPRRPEPTLLQRVSGLVKGFREGSLYARLADVERRAFDDRLQEPMNDIVAGRLALRIGGGTLQAATTSDDGLTGVRALANSDAGYWLLVRLAEGLPSTGKAPGTWHAVEQGCDAETPVRGRPSPGIGE